MRGCGVVMHLGHESDSLISPEVGGGGGGEEGRGFIRAWVSA